MRVRKFEESDRNQVRACIVLLQDHEQALDARMPAGEDIADAYLEHVIDGCRKWSGTIYVAEEARDLLGFVCVWTRYRSGELDDGPEEYGLVSDLVVVPQARGRGVGRALLERAEACARQAGAQWLRVGVLATNAVARSLYSTAGFKPWLEYLEKQLRDAGAVASSSDDLPAVGVGGSG